MSEEVAPIQEEVAPAEAVPAIFDATNSTVELVSEAHNAEVVVEQAPVIAVAKSKNEEPVAPIQAKLPGKLKVVRLSALVYNSNARNSVSVGLVQERLAELGFHEAKTDKYGWLSDGTMKSLADFAKTSVEKTNPQDAELIGKLFRGTQVTIAE